MVRSPFRARRTMSNVPHFVAVVACACAPSMATRAHAADGPPNALRPGADLADCRSALRTGPTACTDGPATADTAAGEEGGAPSHPVDLAVPPLEAQVDAFLASFGKPPREAIRALLDPSDAHILAMARKQDETLAIAAYVAARMTQLQRQGAMSAAPGSGAAAPDLPDLMQMSVTLYHRPDDVQAQPALKALQDLAQEVPALRAQVALVGEFTAQQLRREVARVAAPLTARAVRPDECAADALPFLRIEDLRFRRMREVDARDLAPADLRRLIAALRAEAAGHGAPQGGVKPGESGSGTP